MIDPKSLSVLKKYYLPYRTTGKPSANEMEQGILAGVLVPASEITHDKMISGIKDLSERISLTAAAKGFLYSLSSGDMRYRTAISSLVWARMLPNHTAAETERKNDRCGICGCSHGLDQSESVDWNEYGVFRYLPPTHYGKQPNFTCAEYVLNDLREFEKLPAVEPCDEDYRILNNIFAVTGTMKPHNTDTALLSEIRRMKIIDATGNGIHCILAILSICSVLENADHKGFLNGFTNSADIGRYRDDLSFYPLFFWRGKDGINYAAVKELFGSFSGENLAPEKAVIEKASAAKPPKKKTVSKAEQYYAAGTDCITLTDEERYYLALDAIQPKWEQESLFSVTHNWRKRTILFYEGNTIVKIINEEQYADGEGKISSINYRECDTRLETDDRKMLLPLISRGSSKPITPTNVMAVLPFGCELYLYLHQNESMILARNPRNNQEIALGEKKRIQRIVSDKDFHEFMQHYISTCPDSYFERIAEVRGMEHQTVRFRAGDIFRCQIDRTHFTYGIILGKTRELEKWPELPERHSYRSQMAQPIIVRMYDFVTTDTCVSVEQLTNVSLRPPEICADNDIIWGTHKITAHKELEPDDVQFQIHLARQTTRNGQGLPFAAENFTKIIAPALPDEIRKKGKPPASLYVEWGFATCELPWEDVPECIRKMLQEGYYFNGGVRFGISGEYCGKTLADILSDTPKNALQYDLLLLENRKSFNLVMNCLGLPDDCSYDDFAEKYGGISRERYIELVKERSR